MKDAINRLEVLQALLRAPLRVTAVKEELFPPGRLTPDAVIVTHRFLIIREGGMDYTVEGRARRLERGTQFFVPAWCRREWRVGRRSGGCRLLWCEFSSGSVDVSAGLFWREPAERSLEEAAFERLRVAGEAADERAAALRQEGELKACLARFWPEARMEGVAGGPVAAAHPEVARAVAWLERNFAEPDALEGVYRTLTLSPNHFRLLFRRQAGETVQARLGRLRLRRARYLVQETAMPMKQIAGETGFGDPLYFSSQYKKFWGRPATEDRRSGGVA